MFDFLFANREPKAEIHYYPPFEAIEVDIHAHLIPNVDDGAPNILHRSTVLLLPAHQHVYLAVAEAVAGGDFAAHLAHHLVGNLARGQAQAGCAFLVKANLHPWLIPVIMALQDLHLQSAMETLKQV